MDRIAKERYQEYYNNLNEGSKQNLANMSYVIYPSEIYAGLHKDNILAGFDIANTPGNDMLAEKWERQKAVVINPGGGVLTQRLRDKDLPSTIYFDGENNPYTSDTTFVGDRIDAINRSLITNRTSRLNRRTATVAAQEEIVADAREALVRARLNQAPLNTLEGLELTLGRELEALRLLRATTKPAPITAEGDEDIGDVRTVRNRPPPPPPSADGDVLDGFVGQGVKRGGAIYRKKSKKDKKKNKKVKRARVMERRCHVPIVFNDGNAYYLP